MNSLIDYVILVDDVLTSIECKNIVKWYEDNVENEYESVVVNSDDVLVASGNRNSKSIDVPLNCYADHILSKAVSSSVLRYVNFINESYKLKDQNTWVSFLPTNFESEIFVINKYDTNQEYKWHTDQSYNFEDIESFSRQFSVVIYLNDNFSGGETEFQFTKIKPKTGSCLVFPSNFMFSHCSRPVTNGVKYCVASFLCPKLEKTYK